MSQKIKVVSSMATKSFLLDAAKQYLTKTGVTLDIAAAGAVDVVRRMKADEPADIVALAAAALDDLIAAGKVIAETRTALVHSPMCVAVPKGAPRHDISTEAALQKAVLAAGTVAYSSGSSGIYLEKLLTRWGVTDKIKSLQTPPGVPAGSLVQKGEAALAFQQLSELIHLSGLDVLGPLPKEIALVTTFVGGVSVFSSQADAASAALAYLASPDVLEAKRKNGLDPA
jgi:molybdate transport system substrate-binding protein